MSVKRYTLVFLAFWLSLFQGYAQQVYQSKHYGYPGTQQLYRVQSTGIPTEEIEQSGEDVTWDIQDLQSQKITSFQILSTPDVIDPHLPDFTCLINTYPQNAFQCFKVFLESPQTLSGKDSLDLTYISFQDVNHLQRVTESGLLETIQLFRMDSNLGELTLGTIYNAPDTVLKFPFTYSDSWTSHNIWEIDLASLGLQLQYRSQQFRESEADGWGTIITPYDTFTNVVRVRSELFKSDLATTDTLILPIEKTEVEYSWYDTANGLPVMIASGILSDSGEVLNNVLYTVDIPCADPTWTVTTDTDIYSLNSTGSAFVTFRINQSNADLYTWYFGSGITAISKDSITYQFDQPGLYSVIVEGCMTNCLPLNSCSSDTIQIEVRDTTSAVFTPDPSAVGIHLYPNPASGSISLDIPKTLQGDISYQFLDLVGNRVLEGKAKAGVSQINIRDIPDGMYFIWISNPMTKTRYAAVPVVVAQ